MRHRLADFASSVFAALSVVLLVLGSAASFSYVGAAEPLAGDDCPNWPVPCEENDCYWNNQCTGILLSCECANRYDEDAGAWICDCVPGKGDQ